MSKRLAITGMTYNSVIRAFTTTLADGSIGPTVSVDAVIAKDAEVVNFKAEMSKIEQFDQASLVTFNRLKAECDTLYKKYESLIADINAILDKIEKKVGVN